MRETKKRGNGEKRMKGEKQIRLNFEQAQRERIREKQDYKCYFCRKSIRNKKANTVHHICPKSLGGDWQLYNLVCLCSDCHSKLESLNRRMLLKLAKLDCLRNYCGHLPSNKQFEIELERSASIFNLKYKPNFKWFSLEIDNLLQKKVIDINALNKINELKNELANRLNYNHSLDMNHIEILKQRIQEIESKMKELRAKKHLYRTEMNKLKTSLGRLERKECRKPKQNEGEKK